MRDPRGRGSPSRTHHGCPGRLCECVPASRPAFRRSRCQKLRPDAGPRAGGRRGPPRAPGGARPAAPRRATHRATRGLPPLRPWGPCPRRRRERAPPSSLGRLDFSTDPQPLSTPPTLSFSPCAQGPWLEFLSVRELGRFACVSRAARDLVLQAHVWRNAGRALGVALDPGADIHPREVVRARFRQLAMGPVRRGWRGRARDSRRSKTVGFDRPWLTRAFSAAARLGAPGRAPDCQELVRARHSPGTSRGAAVGGGAQGGVVGAIDSLTRGLASRRRRGRARKRAWR